MDSENVLEWFRFAAMDLAVAAHACSMHPKPLEIICYHCQQSAEKYLKGYLISQGMEAVPRIHDLVVLRELCAKFDARFDEITDVCEVLTQYGVQPRYPDELTIDEPLTQKALRCAEKISVFPPLRQARVNFES